MVATLSINPRRVEVLISTSLFDIESEDLIETWFDEDGTNADDGDTRARAVNAADRREFAMVARKLNSF